MSTVSASDWIKGISLSIMASIIGGASKLAIRKSWLMESSEVNTDVESPESSAPPSTTGPTCDEARQFEGYEHQQDDPVEDLIEEIEEMRMHSDEDEDEDAVAAGESGRRQQQQHWVALALRGSGMVGMTFLNPACCVLAMNYASPSILAPFSGLTLVWIVLFSQPLIGEEPSCNQVSASSLIVLGEVIVAIFGDHTNNEGVTVQDIRESYRYPPFLLYLFGLFAWMLILWIWMQYDGTNNSDNNNNHVRETLKRFSWGAAGGSVTGLQNFLKDSLTILKAVQVEEDTGGSFTWYLPIMVLLAAGSAFGGLLFLTACMKRYDATFSSAMLVGSFVVSASIMSAVHYATFAHLESAWNWVLYPLGLVILMAGVWMLVHEQEQRVVLDQRSRNTGPVEMVSLRYS